MVIFFEIMFIIQVELINYDNLRIQIQMFIKQMFMLICFFVKFVFEIKLKVLYI